MIRGRKDLLGDTTSGIAKATDQRIGGSNNVLVEEASGPDLAGNESSTEDADEKADEVQAHGVLRSASQCSRDCAGEEQVRKGLTRANVIAHGTGDYTDEQSCSERNDVRVGNFVLGQMQIGLDTLTQLGEC